MAHNDLERFRELVLGEAGRSLRQELEPLFDWEVFAGRLIELARQRGLDVTRADIEAARSAATREWFERWI